MKEKISPAEATEIIFAKSKLLPTETVPFAQAQGRILRAPLKADRALPPFDRVMMDGIAIAASVALEGQRSFPIAGMQAAGVAEKTLTDPTTCYEVMTGSLLPRGADCVIPYELCSIENNTATLSAEAVIEAFHFVHRQGSDFPADSELVPSGVKLTSRQLAVAASSGYAQLEVSCQPKIAIISTGDELVSIEEKPEPFQIRRSNSHSLAAGLTAMGLSEHSLHHLPDDAHIVETQLQQIIAKHDLLILSGGISKGKKDYLPQAFEKLGVQKEFQWVQQRPGKPFWFGKQIEKNTLVFALPGNPLSTLTCLHRYVKPALETMLGLTPETAQYVTLSEAFSFPPPLNYFLPVQLIHTADGQRQAIPKPANNSGDYASIIATDGFVELPASQSDFEKGYSACFIPWL